MSTQKRSCIVSHVWQLAEGTITIGRPSNPKSTPTYFYRFLKFKVTGRRIDDNAEEQGNNSNNIDFKHPRYQDGFCLSCACSDMDNLRENLHRDHLSFWGISQEDTLAVLEKIFKVQNDRGNGSIIVVILDVDVDMNIQYDHDTEAANNNDNILLDRNMIRESLEDTTQGAEVAELISKLKFGLQGLEEVSDVYSWEVLWKERKCPLCKKNLSVWWKKRERIVRLPCSHLYQKDCIEEQVMKAKNYGCRSCREREHMDLLLIWYGVIHRPYVIRKCYEQVFKFLWF